MGRALFRAFAFAAALVGASVSAEAADPPSYKIGAILAMSGQASWYGPWHEGKLMANHHPFRMMQPTVAHRTLPLGTIVEVTNLAANRIAALDRAAPPMPDPGAEMRVRDAERRAASAEIAAREAQARLSEAQRRLSEATSRTTW